MCGAASIVLLLHNGGFTAGDSTGRSTEDPSMSEPAVWGVMVVAGSCANRCALKRTF